MTNIQDYPSLVSAMVNYFEDDSDEFKSFIPSAIDLCEQRLTREVDTTALVTSTVVSTAAGNRLVTKPSGYRFGYNLNVQLSNGEFRTLTKSTKSYIEDYWPWFNTSVATPKYYADHGTTQWVLGPTPRESRPARITYATRPTGISAANPTNYFTNYMADALYFGTAIEMAKFARQKTMLQFLEPAYQNCIQTIMGEGRRERRDEGMEPASPAANRNDLLGGN